MGLHPSPDFASENSLWQSGLRAVCGIDEAGRGPWAGPVYAAAVVFPPELNPYILKGLTDSKLLSPKSRDFWFDIICEQAAGYGIAKCECQEIDQKGILPCTKKAMLSAVAQLPECDYLLLDAVRLTQKDFTQAGQAGLERFLDRQESFIRGEQVSLSIAAASVLAKVSRDREMCLLDQKYPAYGFSRHKGYGTREHEEALKLYGACPLHRRSFQPIRELVTARP